MSEAETCGDCRRAVEVFYPGDLEFLCTDCRNLEVSEVAEIAREARAQPFSIPSFLPRRKFGTGENEIPSSAIVSVLAARELEERRGGRLIVGEVVLVGLTLAAVAVAELAGLWLEFRF